MASLRAVVLRAAKLVSGALLNGRVLPTLGLMLLGAALCIGITARAASPEGEAVRSFKHCIEGSASDREAEQVGLILGQRYYDLFFDPGILSEVCVNKIVPHAFVTYDEPTSLKLVLFFWNDAFLSRLYQVSLSNSEQLSCDLSCLLGLERRLLPSLSLFDELARDAARVPAPKNAFLLARSLFLEQRASPEQISKLLDKIEDSNLRNDVIRYLYLLASAENVRNTFEQTNDPPQICVMEKCVEITKIEGASNCGDFNAKVVALKMLADMIALKSWVLNEGHNVVEDCVVEALHEPLEKIGETSISHVFELFVFDPGLQFTDVVADFKADVFRTFDFLNQDISRLSNLDLGKMQASSGSFARRVVPQLEMHPEAVSLFDDPAHDAVKNLLTLSSSGARFQLLLCKHNRSPNKAGCDRQEIYLEAMERSFRW
jgi:hypothetical protein